MSMWLAPAPPVGWAGSGIDYRPHNMTLICIRVKLHFSHVPPVGLDLPTRVKSLTAPFSYAFYSITMRKDLTALEQIPALVIVIV